MTITQEQRTRTTVHGNPWRPSWRGTGLVMRIEMLRRRPSTKGYIAYGLTFLAIIGLGILVAVLSGPEKTSAPLELVLILVLGVGFLIGPSLSATSINGDSGEGVLAPLQMTRLTAGDLALGKLLASWAVSIAALVTTTPFLIYAYVRSGWHLDELLIVLAVILFLVLMATAIGLAWSAIAARAVASVSLAHLTSGALILGTLLMFAFTAPLVTEEVVVTDRYRDTENLTEEQWNDPNFDYESLPCVEFENPYQLMHSDQTAWLLLMNPGVVIAEVSPIVNPETYEKDGRAAPGIFALIHSEVAGARMAPEQPQGYDECEGVYDENEWQKRQTERALMEGSPWIGLGLAAVLLVGSLVIVIRRLRVPYKTLRAGSRVA